MQRTLSLIIGLILLFTTVPAFAVTDVFTNPEDSYIRITSRTANYGSENVLIADGVGLDPDNGKLNEVASLIQWDISSIPPGATVTAAKVTLNFTDSSSGPYNFHSQFSPWAESTVTWNDFDPDTNILGTIPPSTFGITSIELNANGIAVVQGWVDGSFPNNGLAIRTGGTNNGINMDSKESGGTIPTLEVTYTNDNPPTVESLLIEINKLKGLLAGAKREGNTLVLEGMNLQIISGSGATNGNPDSPANTEPEQTAVNGLGNIIVGYNESVSSRPKSYSGSHNIVVGNDHSFSSFGGLVVGRSNTISGVFSSVSGGQNGTASGRFSSISGGVSNIASEFNSSVSGGLQNHASGAHSSVSGGLYGTSSGLGSSLSGGNSRTASGNSDWVAGSLFESF